MAHFKKSELACTKLKEKQQQMGKPPHVDTGCQYPVEQYVSHVIKTPGTAMACFDVCFEITAEKV